MSWRDYVRPVTPYVPGEQPKESKVIKLNTNENPYPPAPGIDVNAFRSEAAVADGEGPELRKYPDPTAHDLVSAIAAYHGVEEEQVFVGVGSDDVLGMAFLTFFNSEKPVLFPDISYSFYPVWADLFKIPFKTVPLTEDYRIRTSDYMLPEGEVGGVVFPNPNAPTAILLPLDSVEEIISANRDSIVIVDEAYIDFAPEGSSALSLLPKYDNLLVVRTFSKSRSMAGLRIGYAVGSKEVIAAMQAVKYSYNSYTMNQPSILWGCASIKDDAYFRATVGKIVDTRERFTKKLKELGFTVLPSSANFVFAGHPEVPASEIFAAARAKGIFFRYFAQPRIDNFLRITIGTDEDMDTVVSFLNEYLG